MSMNGAAARELFEYSGYAPDNGGGIAGVRDMFRLPLGAQNEEENALVEEGALQPNADTFYGRYKNLFEWDRLKEGIPVASPSKTRTDNWAQYESFAAQAADQHAADGSGAGTSPWRQRGAEHAARWQEREGKYQDASASSPGPRRHMNDAPARMQQQPRRRQQQQQRQQHQQHQHQQHQDRHHRQQAAPSRGGARVSPPRKEITGKITSAPPVAAAVQPSGRRRIAGGYAARTDDGGGGGGGGGIFPWQQPGAHRGAAEAPQRRVRRPAPAPAAYAGPPEVVSPYKPRRGEQPTSPHATRFAPTHRLEKWGYNVVQDRKLQNASLPRSVQSRLAAVQQLDARRRRLRNLLEREGQTLSAARGRTGWNSDLWNF